MGSTGGAKNPCQPPAQLVVVASDRQRLTVIADFQEVLGVPVVLVGFGLPDDNVHAPNEKLHLPTFRRGIEALIHYYALFGEGGS